MKSKPLYIRAVLFDFDGTLTEPGALDFDLLKRTIGCSPETPVLEFIASRPTLDRQQAAQAVLENFERIAALNSKPNGGAEDLIHHLRSKGLALGILTRNRLVSIKRALQNFKTLDVSDFDLIITRDTPVKPKPAPDGILLAAQRLKTDPGRLLVVGDFAFDIQAGQRAGSPTVFLDNGRTPGPYKIEGDFRISRLGELKKIVR